MSAEPLNLMLKFDLALWSDTFALKLSLSYRELPEMS